MMRVQLITDGTAVGTTGLSRYSSALLCELQRMNVDIELMHPTVPYSKVLRVLGRMLNLDPMTFFSNYPVKIEHRPADVYHLASENLASLLMFQRLRPVVVTVHAFFTYFLQHDPNLAMHNHIVHRAFDNLAASGLQRADAIIAVSSYVADLMINELGIPSDRVHVIHEAVDPKVFRPRQVPLAFREKYQLDPGRFHFLYVGSEQPRKNFLMLLRAFARVRAEHSNVHLLKIGAPELTIERERAIHLIQELGIEHDVTFLGHVGDDLALFYNASDVFVFPSLYEGFGFPPLEAMACGTPTICSSTTSLPEVVGDAAITIKPDDENDLFSAMQHVLDNPAAGDYLRIKGLARAATFSWNTTALQTAALYEQVT